MNHEAELAKFWLNVSAYYRQTLPDAVLKMYVFDCKNISLEELRSAFERYRQTSRAEFFPLPAVLKNIARPPIDEDAEANEVVARIVQCLSPFKSADAAREHMGELAWEVVRSLGGWHSLGQRPPPDGFAMRDMREMAKAKLVRARQGRADELPSLGGSDRPQIASHSNTNGQEHRVKLTALVSDTLKDKDLK